MLRLRGFRKHSLFLCRGESLRSGKTNREMSGADDGGRRDGGEVRGVEGNAKKSTETAGCLFLMMSIYFFKMRYFKVL